MSGTGRSSVFAVAACFAYSATATAQHELRLRVDVAALLTVDGQALEEVAADQPRVLQLEPGQHLLTLNSAGGEARWEQVVDVPAPSGELAVRLAPSVREVQSQYVKIPSGSFEMGCVDDDALCGDDERPRHTVRLSRAFWMMTSEVTVAAYRAYAQASGAPMPPESDTNPGWTQARHPIVNLSWRDAVAFCRRVGGRLPTEAEWEYAARGARLGARYVWGNESTPLVRGRKQANVGDERAKRKVQCDSCGWFDGYDDAFTYTAPVGSFSANGFGLFDMAGNVWEWTADWYSEQYYNSSPGVDPSGREYGQWRTLRGGSWSVNPVGLRASYRFGFPPAERSDNFGVRCVRDVAIP